MINLQLPCDETDEQFDGTLKNKEKNLNSQMFEDTYRDTSALG